MSDTNNRSALINQVPQAISFALDGTKVGFELSDRIRYLDEQVLTLRKRTLIEHYRIYLSTLDEFKPIFEKVKPTGPRFTSKS